MAFNELSEVGASSSDVLDSDSGDRRQTWRKRPCVFRLNERDGPELLLQVLAERNWVTYNENVHGKHGWNFWWVTGQRQGLDSLQPWQYVNRIPQAGILTRKDRLLRCLRCMQLGFGSIYDFTPLAFVLPNEYVRFVLEYSKGRGSPTRNVWICKPTDQSRGRGITIFRDLHKLSYSNYAVVQRYLCNSLLVSGYKFDLRLYVCILSFRPLTVYVYNDGLVRFATEPFDLQMLQNPFSHITNCSINKFSPAYDEGKGSVGLGCKWTIRQLRHYFASANVSDWLLWQRIGHIILLTLLCEAPLISSNSNTFELYGFDVIVDENYTPWLLEVNRHPSLGLDCDVDILVKKPLLHDLMDLLGIEESTMDTQPPRSSGSKNGEATLAGSPPSGAPHRRLKPAVKLRSSKSMVTTADNDAPCNSKTSSHLMSTACYKDPAPTIQQQAWVNQTMPRVGGFTRLFPTGSRSWKSPTQTRGIVQYVRQIERQFARVSRMVKKQCEGRAPDDEDYLKVLQNVMGTEDVLVWAPCQ